MKYQTLFLFLALLPFISSCQTPDLSTDDAVLEFICNEKDISMEDARDWICIDRFYNHDNIIVIGSFAHDAGCFIESIIVNGTMGDWDTMTDKALAEMGWSDESKRKELLLQFIDDTSMGWGYVQDSRNDEFDHKNASEFTEPIVTETDGEFTVEFWVMGEAGMMPESNYYKMRVVFSANGELINSESIDSFTVPYDGYEND